MNDLHPTMKPVAPIEQAVRNISREGALVLDPFAGSGSTLIACQKSGRQTRLIELDPQYVDVIVRRWQEFTGREATGERSRRLPRSAPPRQRRRSEYEPGSAL